jgi:N-hydroxyarylamine O-acetyltransferase
MCHYHQTSPKSGFTRGNVCSLTTTMGRATITDQRLLITTGVEQREADLTDEAAWAAALRNYRGIAF